MKFVLNSSLILLLGQAVVIQAAPTVTNIALGQYHSLFVKSDGSLWGMGYDHDGELGDGTYGQISLNYGTNRPERIVASHVIAVAAGDAHSLFIKSDGSLWGMGLNFYGELGDGTFSTTNLPEQIVASNVVAIAAGGGDSLFLESNGSLWGMGENATGALGDGTFNGTNRPEQILDGKVVAMATGGGHSLFLKSDGSLWATGNDDEGQLGDGRSDNWTNRPEEIVSNAVVAIAAGAHHSLFLKSDGSLWGMGEQLYGQLGDGSFGDPNSDYRTNSPEEIVSGDVVAIAAGFEHSLYLKSDGSLWAMGLNNLGELGDGTVNMTNRPEEIVSGGVVAIAAGGEHSLFLKSDGSLWVMGDNYDGEDGDGFIGNSAHPEQIFPVPQPVLTDSISSKTNLQIKATCKFGGNFTLLASTNLTGSLNQWTAVRTNSVTFRGTNNFTATLTNVLGSGGRQQFYILQSQ